MPGLGSPPVRAPVCLTQAVGPLLRPCRLDRIDQGALPLNGVFDPVGGGAGVHIYVLDTGLLSTHEDFVGRVGARGLPDAVGVGSGVCGAPLPLAAPGC